MKALALLIAVLLPASSGAQETFGAAASAASLRSNGASARALAMGGAFVGLADDSASLYFNPAGLAGRGRSELAVNHHSWIEGIYEEQGVAAIDFGRAGGLGLGLDYTDFGNFEGRAADGSPTLGYGAHRLGGSLAWAMGPWSGVRVGLGASAFQQSLADADSGAFSGSLGLLWEPWSGSRLGASYMDIGGSVAGAQLGSPLRAGLSQSFNQGGKVGGIISAAGDFESAGVNRVSLGMELSYLSVLMLRAGYRLDLADKVVEGFSGASAGAGFQLGGWRLDYAYLPYGDLGASQRISLVRDFGAGSPVPAPRPAASPTPSPSPEAASPAAAVPNGGSALSLQFSLPADPYAHVRELAAQGQNAAAVAELQGMIRARGEDVRAWRMLADLYRKAGFKDYAINCYEQVLRLRPDPALQAWLDQYRSTPQSSTTP